MLFKYFLVCINFAIGGNLESDIDKNSEKHKTDKIHSRERQITYQKRKPFTVNNCSRWCTIFHLSTCLYILFLLICLFYSYRYQKIICCRRQKSLEKTISSLKVLILLVPATILRISKKVLTNLKILTIVEVVIQKVINKDNQKVKYNFVCKKVQKILIYSGFFAVYLYF
jgi:hypothetical protein